MKLQSPYLLFLGDAKDPFAIKLARGVVDWRPELAIGEYSLPECQITTGLKQLSISQAKAQGAKSLVLGLANSGGTIQENWITTIRAAIAAGFDIISGMHQALNAMPELVALAKEHGVTLNDIRHPKQHFTTGTGEPRSGKRLLAVGTDCSAGKMYTTLAIQRELAKLRPCTFRATGQTGILIAGEGVAIDCVVADFISGAVESLSPDNADDHWDIIEGQGSLFHPAFAGVSLGLLHGAQADALVLCHVEGRASMRGLANQPLPDIATTMAVNLQAAHLTNPNAKFVGISVNTSSLDDTAAQAICDKYAAEHNLPAVDPLRHSVAPIIENICAI